MHDTKTADAVWHQVVSTLRVLRDAAHAAAASVITPSTHTAVMAWLKIDGLTGCHQLLRTTFGPKQISAVD